MDLNETINTTILTLAITLVTALMVRSLLSFLSVYHTLSIAWLTFQSNLKEVYSKMISQMKKVSITAAAMFLMLAVLMPAFTFSASAAPASQVDQQVLQLRYDNVNARVAFVTGYMGDIVNLVPQASNLQSSTDKLNADMSTLQGYVSSNDNKGFNDYVTGTITPDVKAAMASVKSDRDQFKAWNVTVDTRKTLQSDYQSLKSTYDSTISSNNAQLYSDVLNDRISNYNAAIQKNDGVIANMSSKGYDVSGMQAVQGYGKNVVSKLQGVQGSDPTTIKNMLKAEGLGNGPTYSEHYFAEFDLARLQSVSAKISPTVAASNNAAAQQAFAAANSQLGSVNSLLQSINHQPYSGGQQDQVWGDSGLKGAAQNLKTVVADLKPGTTQG